MRQITSKELEITVTTQSKQDFRYGVCVWYRPEELATIQEIIEKDLQSEDPAEVALARAAQDFVQLYTAPGYVVRFTKTQEQAEAFASTHSQQVGEYLYRVRPGGVDIVKADEISEPQA